MALSRSLLLASLLSVAVHSVDRSNFKTCDQSGFCKRLRKTDSQLESPFSIDESSLSVRGDSVVATLLNEETQVRFQLELWAVKDGIFRFKIKEAYPLRQRLQVPEVLVSEPEVLALKSSKSSGGNILEVSPVDGDANIAAKIYLKPFKIEFFEGGEHVMTANGRGKLVFEETKRPEEGGDLSESFKGHTDSVPHGHTGIGMDFTFVNTKHVYGLPEHTDGLSLKDTISGDPYRMYNLDVFEYELNERMSLYASIPVTVSHSAKRSAGLFWLNAAETWVDVVHGPSGVLGTFGLGSEAPYVDTTWISESGIIDAFVMLGPGPKNVAAQYAKLTGTTPLPPLFSIGYHQCRWNYRDEADVADVNANFDVHDIPMDVLWLDIEHTDGKRYFTWDSTKFPTPDVMIGGLSAVGRKLVTIVDPHIKVDGGYDVYSDGKARDLFVKDKSGSEFNGWCWPGNSAYMDWLNPEARDYFADRYKIENYRGSSNDLHIWNDMNEPSVFNGPEITMQKDNLHVGGVEHRDVHNIYGHLYTMVTHEGLFRRGEGKLRPFTLTRSAFAGTQRYAALWTGDNTADWDHLAASIPMCLSLSLAGITFVGADVGGFFGNPDPELLVRWYQAGAFQPFFRGHAHLDTKRREPWLFGEENTRLIRNAIRERYRHLPVWYAAFYENEKTGVPPMRPIYFEFPKLEESFDMESSFMVGSSLLVNPVTKAGVSSWDVYLPPTAIWYDNSGKKTATSTIGVTMDTIPVYQRGGTIVPTLERVRRSTAVMMNDPYTLTVALDANAEADGVVYIDDGRTYEYRSGNYNLVKLKFKGNTLTATREGSYETPAWVEAVKVYGFSCGKPKSVTVDGTEVGFKYSAQLGTLTVRKPNVKLSKSGWSIKINC